MTAAELRALRTLRRMLDARGWTISMRNDYERDMWDAVVADDGSAGDDSMYADHASVAQRVWLRSVRLEHEGVLCTATLPDGGRAAVLLPEEGRLSVNTVRQIAAAMAAKPALRTWVVVCADGARVSAQAAEEVGRMESVSLSCFTTGDLAVWHRDSDLLPEYRVLPPDEAARVRERFGAGNLPILALNDPLVRALDLRAGTVVYFKRMLRASDPYEYWREVGTCAATREREDRKKKKKSKKSGND